MVICHLLDCLSQGQQLGFGEEICGDGDTEGMAFLVETVGKYQRGVSGQVGQQQVVIAECGTDVQVHAAEQFCLSLIHI